MNLIEKIKLLFAIEKFWEKLKTMSNLVAWFNGKKTLIGLVLVGGYYAGKAFGYPVPDMVLNTGMGLAGVGVAHKFEKFSGVLTAVVGVAHKVLDGVQSFVNALNGSK